MTKYDIYLNEDDPLQYLISVGHFSKETVLKILISKKIIAKSDNLHVSEICSGWGRKSTDEDVESNYSDDGIVFLFHRGNAMIPISYKTKTTYVKMCESD